MNINKVQNYTKYIGKDKFFKKIHTMKYFIEFGFLYSIMKHTIVIKNNNYIQILVRF